MLSGRMLSNERAKHAVKERNKVKAIFFVMEVINTGNLIFLTRLDFEVLKENGY